MSRPRSAGYWSVFARISDVGTVAATIAVGLAAASGSGQLPHMVADLTTAPRDDVFAGSRVFSSSITLGCSSNGVGYFINADANHLSQLWRTDGTPEGTRIFRHLPFITPPRILGAISGRVLLGGSSENTVWAAGPGDTCIAILPMRSIFAGSPQLNDPTPTTVLNGRLVFPAVRSEPLTNGRGEQILIATDGTSEGTSTAAIGLVDPFSTPSITSLATIGGRVACMRGTSEIWEWDGGPGPATIREPVAGGGQVLALGDDLLFQQGTGFGVPARLWRSNTQPANLQLLSAQGACSTSPGVSVPGGALFLFNLLNCNHPGLGFTDGTPEGTRQVLAVRELSSFPRPVLIPFRNRAVFRAFLSSAPSQAIMQSDGTELGTTVLFRPSTGAPGQVLAVAGEGADQLAYFLYFSTRTELWVSDGSPSGTRRVPGMPTLPSSTSFGVRGTLGNSLLVSLIQNGRTELWLADPVAGVSRFLCTLSDLTTRSSMLGPTLPQPGGVFFGASVTDAGHPVWIMNAQGGALQPCPSDNIVAPTEAVFSNGRLLAARSRTQVNSDGSTTTAAWLSSSVDACDPGQVLLQAQVTGLTDLGTRLVFAGPDLAAPSPYTWTIWSTDGTLSGTAPLGTGPDRATVIRASSAFAGRFWFCALRGDTGPECLWSTDGTPEGTSVEYVFEPDRQCSDLVPVGDKLVIVRYVLDAGGWYSGNDLCVLARRGLAPRRVDSLPRITSSSGPFSRLGSRAFLFAGDGPGGSRQLWKLDLESLAVDLVATIPSGGMGYAPVGLTSVQLESTAKAFFNVDDGLHGRELWVTNGTPEGTRMVIDLWPGYASSYPGNFLPVDDSLFFTANTGPSGFELWKTDGTETGTSLVADIYPGPGSSSPANLRRIGNRLFFTAASPGADRELWTLRLTPCPADFNADDTLSADDLGEFIACFFAAPTCDDADFNHDGDLNADDLAEFVMAYFSGCDR